MPGRRASAGKGSNVDVLVAGEHPSAFFAAALLASGGKLSVVQVVPPRAPKATDRLVWINPALFRLSPLLAKMRAELPTTASKGIQFLTADPRMRSSHQADEPVALSARLSTVRQAMADVAKAAGVRCVAAKSLRVGTVDENAVTLEVGSTTVQGRMLVLSDGCPEDQRAFLGLHHGWDAAVSHRYTSVRCPANMLAPGQSAMQLQCSLNLDGAHHWGWLLPGAGEVQLTVEEPLRRATAQSATKLLGVWLEQLHAAGVVQSNTLPAGSVRTELTLPAAGALAEEAVGNRTLLIGPAGGFVSACGEEIYPGCWSAVFADKVARKALREHHLQDALQPYRQLWRTTLGEYLRGPRDHLPFLLPLMFKNSVLTDRLAEAILLGKPVVR